MAEKEKRGYQTTTSEYHGQFGQTINRGTGEAPGITAEGLARRLDRATVLDARERKHYGESDKVIPGSKRVDPEDLSWTEELNKELSYVVYCATPGENTCSLVAKRMIERGFKHVHVLMGGWPAWVEAGLPTAEKGTVSA
jgi:rhodanese-related sulfurtransferase